jgi:hypothetical protein
VLLQLWEAAHFGNGELVLPQQCRDYQTMMQNKCILRCRLAVKHANSKSSMCSADMLDDLPPAVESELETIAGRPVLPYGDLVQGVAQ